MTNQECFQQALKIYVNTEYPAVRKVMLAVLIRLQQQMEKEAVTNVH